MRFLPWLDIQEVVSKLTDMNSSHSLLTHSRCKNIIGSVAGLKFATTVEKPLPFFVNVSGRYKMNDNQIYRNRPEIGEALKKQGYFDWRVKQRDRIVSVKVTQKEVDRFINWSNEHGKEKLCPFMPSKLNLTYIQQKIVSRMPMSTCVLTCHGLKDTVKTAKPLKN